MIEQMSYGDFIALTGNNFDYSLISINTDDSYNLDENMNSFTDEYFSINTFQYSDGDNNNVENKEDNKEQLKIQKKSEKPQRKKKEKILLTPQGKEFRDMFDYHLGLNHKKIRKEKVQALYNNVCDELKLPKMAREEIRSINKFFNNFAFAGIKIIKAIKKQQCKTK